MSGLACSWGAWDIPDNSFMKQLLWTRLANLGQGRVGPQDSQKLVIVDVKWLSIKRLLVCAWRYEELRWIQGGQFTTQWIKKPRIDPATQEGKLTVVAFRSVGGRTVGRTLKLFWSIIWASGGRDARLTGCLACRIADHGRKPACTSPPVVSASATAISVMAKREVAENARLATSAFGADEARDGVWSWPFADMTAESQEGGSYTRVVMISYLTWTTRPDRGSKECYTEPFSESLRAIPTTGLLLRRAAGTGKVGSDR